jgi:hypothetical protein
MIAFVHTIRIPILFSSTNNTITIDNINLKSIQQSHKHSKLIINCIKSLGNSSNHINDLIVKTRTIIYSKVLYIKNFPLTDKSMSRKETTTTTLLTIIYAHNKEIKFNVE